ncbi:MAG: hypothetical protein GY871_04165 [Actinomycetales bacterium]|nr:hypothetical protein [Actinomycetales bacterium]
MSEDLELVEEIREGCIYIVARCAGFCGETRWKEHVPRPILEGWALAELADVLTNELAKDSSSGLLFAFESVDAAIMERLRAEGAPQ